MYHKVEQTFYILSATVLFGIMFVLTPSGTAEVADFQKQIVDQTELAFQQVLSDIDLLEPLDLVWSGVDEFYFATSRETLAVIPAVEVPEAVNLAFHKASTASLSFLAKGLENVLPPTESVSQPLEVGLAPIYNIVPPFTEASIQAYNTRVAPLPITTVVVPSQELAVEVVTAELGQVAGEQIELEQPVNDISRPWVTLKDNLTGQNYCVAIYNNEVNKYLGECKRDYY